MIRLTFAIIATVAGIIGFALPNSSIASSSFASEMSRSHGGSEYACNLLNQSCDEILNGSLCSFDANQCDLDPACTIECAGGPCDNATFFKRCNVPSLISCNGMSLICGDADHGHCTREHTYWWDETCTTNWRYRCRTPGACDATAGDDIPCGIISACQ